ncbi:MAG TPA: hypothetical protein VN495_01550 [Candidatus Paceibacterota bacterium]|nr:hypothetical protein [Candidatus Paceibacterota bacterium]
MLNGTYRPDAKEQTLLEETRRAYGNDARDFLHCVLAGDIERFDQLPLNPEQAQFIRGRANVLGVALPVS